MDTAELSRLVDEAGFIFLGRILHAQTSDERLGAMQDKAVVARIERVLHGTDVLRGLAGTDAFVISERRSELAEQRSFIFLTRCVALGDHVVLRELGRVETSPESDREVLDLIRQMSEKPLRERIAGADLIITGRVERAAPVDPDAPPKSEHDPMRWIARVAVLSVLKGGKADKEVEVLFASSTDIAWYRSPKLREGETAVMLLRHVKAKDAPRSIARALYQATNPLDVLPLERQDDVRRLQ